MLIKIHFTILHISVHRHILILYFNKIVFLKRGKEGEEKRLGMSSLLECIRGATGCTHGYFILQPGYQTCPKPPSAFYPSTPTWQCHGVPGQFHEEDEWVPCYACPGCEGEPIWNCEFDGWRCGHGFHPSQPPTTPLLPPCGLATEYHTLDR